MIVGRSWPIGRSPSFARHSTGAPPGMTIFIRRSARVWPGQSRGTRPGPHSIRRRYPRPMDRARYDRRPGLLFRFCPHAPGHRDPTGRGREDALGRDRRRHVDDFSAARFKTKTDHAIPLADKTKALIGSRPKDYCQAPIRVFDDRWQKAVERVQQSKGSARQEDCGPAPKG